MNEKAMQLTFDEYDEILELFQQMNAPTYWPTLEHIDIMEQEPEKWLLFACYLLEKGKNTRNNEEKYSKKNLSAFINRYLELVEEPSDVISRPMYASAVLTRRNGTC